MCLFGEYFLYCVFLFNSVAYFELQTLYILWLIAVWFCVCVYVDYLCPFAAIFVDGGFLWFILCLVSYLVSVCFIV